MTFYDMIERAMFQYNVDVDDLEDYTPHVDAYINEGYDQVLEALTGYHLRDLPVFPPLNQETDMDVEPKVPLWTHQPICDYATYLLYRNGNPQKQNRGREYLMRFNECLRRCKDLRGGASVNTETGEITVDHITTHQFINYWP